MKSSTFFPGIMALLCVIFLSIGLGSCSKSDDPNQSNAQVSFRLTDGPANYDAIWLDIQQIEVITNASGSIKFTPARPGLYNLLALRNGIDTLLVTTSLQAGTISQIRLILGNNNSIVVGGTSYPLNTPSAQESGLKLNIHETIVAGGSYTFWLDFDAAKSILQTGNSDYKLKPVIRAYTALTNGRIEGYVLPLAALTTVYAINGTDTFSAIPNLNGYYQIGGLPSGMYQVYFEAGAGAYSSVSINNVQVSYGVSLNLGTKVMTP